MLSDILPAELAALLFLAEAVGGVVLGLVLGVLAYQMLKQVNNYQVEMLIMPFTRPLFIAGLLAIIIALFARWASVGGAVLLMKRFRSFSAGAIRIRTWNG